MRVVNPEEEREKLREKAQKLIKEKGAKAAIIRRTGDIELIFDKYKIVYKKGKPKVEKIVETTITFPSGKKAKVLHRPGSEVKVEKVGDVYVARFYRGGKRVGGKILGPVSKFGPLVTYKEVQKREELTPLQKRAIESLEIAESIRTYGGRTKITEKDTRAQKFIKGVVSAPGQIVASAWEVGTAIGLHLRALKSEKERKEIMRAWGETISKIKTGQFIKEQIIEPIKQEPEYFAGSVVGSVLMVGVGKAVSKISTRAQPVKIPVARKTSIKQKIPLTQRIAQKIRSIKPRTEIYEMGKARIIKKIGRPRILSEGSKFSIQRELYYKAKTPPYLVIKRGWFGRIKEVKTIPSKTILTKVRIVGYGEKGKYMTLILTKGKALRIGEKSIANIQMFKTKYEFPIRPKIEIIKKPKSKFLTAKDIFKKTESKGMVTKSGSSLLLKQRTKTATVTKTTLEQKITTTKTKTKTQVLVMIKPKIELSTRMKTLQKRGLKIEQKQKQKEKVVLTVAIKPRIALGQKQRLKQGLKIEEKEKQKEKLEVIPIQAPKLEIPQLTKERQEERIKIVQKLKTRIMQKRLRKPRRMLKQRTKSVFRAKIPRRRILKRKKTRGYGYSDWFRIDVLSQIWKGKKAKHFKLTPKMKKIFAKRFRREGFFLRMPTQEELKGKKKKINFI